MKRIVIISAIGLVLVVGAVFVFGLVGNVVLGGEEQAAGTQYANTSCDASLGPFQGGDAATGTAQAGSLTAQQLTTVTAIITIGKQRNLPALAWQVAIQAGMQESGLRNITYGDRDSVGIFQMRSSQGWGTPAQLTDPTYEINKFYDVLTALPNWQQQRPGTSAQQVERSAFPLAYNNWESMAAALVQKDGQVADPTGCGAGVGDALPAPTKAAGTAIAFALSQIGKPYVWGATGPNSYDCSGLMLRAYQAAGIDLPRVSSDQYHAGALLPVRNAQPGDLMFLAYDPTNPATIHHVFMYLGNNQIVEAPFTGESVRQVPMNWNNPQLVQQAVRPGV
ncbi:MAG TPA: C40 family peptidase [Pseudonocardiaceae bacterium]|jgi:cell wall-associated NlpC family hydrolase|nr:C40 family peptidase [Pseudonocardiaceae bacterium]